MITSADIQAFMKLKKFAVIGVSRTEKKFSYQLYKTLKTKGYNVVPVNPFSERIAGELCYDSILSVPQPVNGVIITVPRLQTLAVVKDTVAAGISNIWLQQGCETKEAIEYCEQNGLRFVHNHCILMFAEPATFPHNLHRGIWKLLGKIPE